MSLPIRIAASAALLVLFAPVAGSASRFSSRTDVVTPFIGPMAIVADDFYDNDGVPDLAVTFGLGKRVVLYRNDGAGNFTATDTLVPQAVPPPIPETGLESYVADKPTMIISGDFNGDTLPDIVGGNEGIQRFFAYRNPGAGTWGAFLDPDARRGNAFDIAAVPWDTDVAKDLVFCFPGRVGIALGEQSAGVPTGVWGDLALFTATGFTVGTQTDIEANHFIQRAADAVAPVVTVTDLLTVDYTGSQIVIWPGDRGFGGTVFATAAECKRFPVQSGATNLTPFEAVVRDWNADGMPDALVASTEGYLHYFQGLGGTTGFGAPTISDLASALAVPTAPRAKTAWTSFVLADVTGDGIDDAVVADAGSPTAEQGFNWLTIVRGVSESPRPVFTDVSGGSEQWHYAAGDLDRQRPGALTVVDVDGDTDLDVVMLNADAVTMTIWRNDGTGHFNGASSFPAGGPLPRGIASNDLNGDSRSETVVALSAPNDAAVRAPALLPPTAAGGLAAPTLIAQPSGAPTGAHGTTLVSVNTTQDANLDLVVTYSTDTFLWKGNGNSTFQAPVALAVGAGEPRFGELWGDAAPDIALGDRSGNRVVIWQGSGTGTFTQQSQIPAIYGYRDHVVASLTGGSKMDIVIAGTNAATDAGVYLISYDNATSSYRAPVFTRMMDIVPDPFADVSRLVAADFDGNGTTDLVGLGSSGQGYFFRIAGGAVTVDSGIVVGGGGSPQGVATGDLSLDGLPDLVVARPTQVTVNDGSAGGFGQLLSLNSNISNDSVAVGDVDGDGRADILAVSTRTSDVTVFLNESAAPLVLRLGGTGGHDAITWSSQGAGATYSVARGDLALMWINRDLGDGTCYRNSIVTTSTTDTDPFPPFRAPPSVFANVHAWWYLVKCSGPECQSPTYGQDSRGADRFGGAAPPDPCP